jgi:hypothetical protein
MFSIIAVLTGTMLRVFRTRRNLLLENLVLRQQLTVLKRKRHRPRIAALDKLFWVLARRFWSRWKQALIIVSPETVVRWHSWICALLACDLQGPASDRQEEDFQRGAGSHLPYQWRRSLRQPNARTTTRPVVSLEAPSPCSIRRSHRSHGRVARGGRPCPYPLLYV